MRLRKQELGDRNLVGARVEAARKKKGMKQKELLAKLQTMGIEISTPALSLLEGREIPLYGRAIPEITLRFLPHADAKRLEELTETLRKARTLAADCGLTGEEVWALYPRLEEEAK